MTELLQRHPGPPGRRQSGGLERRRPLPAGEPRSLPIAPVEWSHRRLGGGGGRCRRVHLLGLPGRRLAEKQRYPHRPRPPLAPSGGPARVLQDRSLAPGLGKALRSYALDD